MVSTLRSSFSLLSLQLCSLASPFLIPLCFQFPLPSSLPLYIQLPSHHSQLVCHCKANSDKRQLYWKGSVSLFMISSLQSIVTCACVVRKKCDIKLTLRFDICLNTNGLEMAIYKLREKKRNQLYNLKLISKINYLY